MQGLAILEEAHSVRHFGVTEITVSAGHKFTGIIRIDFMGTSVSNSFGKRVFDVVVASSALVICAPLMVAITLFVSLSMGSPVLFRQKRPGLHGIPFTLIKFRTMTEARSPDDKLLADGVRLTRAGAFLRRTSLDELPQLWNVLQGEMSLVGPRPLLVEYLPLYTPEQMRRHEAKPGLIGWATVNGRNANTWEEKFRLDVWYVDHWSFMLDLKIFVMAFFTVLSGEGVSEEGEATARRFTGTPQRPDREDRETE